MILWEFLKQPVVIQSIILILSTSLLLRFRLDYRKEKDKNQATKEDIGAITKIVEDIKTNLTKETELLKAQLSFANQHKTNLKSAEREALIEFNKKSSTWHFYMTNFDLRGFTTENYKDLLLLRRELKTREYDYEIAVTHLFVFKHDSDFIDLHKELQESLLGYMGMLLRYADKYHYNFTKYETDRNINGDAMAAIQLKRDNDALNVKYVDEEEEKTKPLHSAHMKLITIIHDQIKELFTEEDR